ncbi:DUF2231 domain-containing protein [Mesoterricola silvestris]|uniref:DUF2231 domain-containing protein n=1 Tax=Mesoterricola silvestris TaxID=2927979 RepID=A0AA48K7J8_9BACT|nr:DUF2231 domain-containing protein [Mesoterricola silvestris]BDU71944.1 hypothetical protein METEAL_11180 [Mesoterricola silvestris]
MLPWNHLHPLIVHFPIALLTTAPAVVLFGLLWPAQRPGIHATALALLVLGTLTAGAALVTGEAGAALAQRTPALRAAVARHEQMAQGAALAFALLTASFGALHLGPWWTRAPRGAMALCALWLGLSALGVLQLTLAAHLGGRMVHLLGLHATPESP